MLDLQLNHAELELGLSGQAVELELDLSQDRFSSACQGCNLPFELKYAAYSVVLFGISVLQNDASMCGVLDLVSELCPSN